MIKPGGDGPLPGVAAGSGGGTVVPVGVEPSDSSPAPAPSVETLESTVTRGPPALLDPPVAVAAACEPSPCDADGPESNGATDGCVSTTSVGVWTGGAPLTSSSGAPTVASPSSGDKGAASDGGEAMSTSSSVCVSVSPELVGSSGGAWI